jgi:hypothetical protein
MDVKAGSRWRSAVSETEVIVVRPPAGPAVLGCGGQPLLPQGSVRPELAATDPAPAGEILIGKRYEDGASGAELLCTKSGAGTLTVDDRPMALKAARPLPASD